MNNPIKIALIDDEALFLEGFSLLFSKLENINVISTANSGQQFFRLFIKPLILIHFLTLL